MDLRQHRVGLGLGEEAAALDRGQLRRIAEHQDRLAEGHEIAAEFGVDHRAFVDHDQRGARSGPIVVEGEARRAILAFARPVDQRMDCRRAGATLRTHHQRRLAGEGGEGGLARRRFGEMAGERRLADAGVAEQAEHLRFARLEPASDLVERARLFARPFADGARRAVGARLAARWRCGALDRGPPILSRGSASAVADRPRRHSAGRRPAACRDRRSASRRPGRGAWRRVWTWA